MQKAVQCTCTYSMYIHNVYTCTCTCAAKSTRIFEKLVRYICSYLSFGTNERPGATFPDVASRYSCTMTRRWTDETK